MSFRPRLVGALQKTGNHRRIATGHHCRDARLENVRLAGGGTRSFRKQNQDIPRLTDDLRTDRQTSTHVRFSAEWQRVDHRRHPVTRDPLKKIIRRCGRISAVQFANRQSGKNTKSIKMTRMVRHNHKRPIGTKLFVSHDLKPVVDSETETKDESRAAAENAKQGGRCSRRATEALNKSSLHVYSAGHG